MTESYTTRNRLTKIGAGDLTNTWGDTENTTKDILDAALDGWATIALTADHTLTTANGASDEARNRMLKLTGTGAYTLTIPAVSKAYAIWNALSGVLTVSNGTASVTLAAGEIGWVIHDGGSNVARVRATDFGGSRLTSVADPTGAQDACTKAYADALAFSSGSGSLPGQTGNSGKFLTTNGSTASWGYAVTAGSGLASVTSSTVSVTGAAASDVRGGSDTTKAVTASALMASSAFQTLTDAATIAWNCASGYNASVTLTASGHTVGAPSGLYDGLCVTLEVVQDATGSRTVFWNAIWDFGAAGTPTLQATAGKADKIHAQYNARTGKLEASFRKGA